MVDSLHGFPQRQRALVLLDRLRRFSQVQVGQAQHLADRCFRQRPIRERLGDLRLGHIHRFAQGHVLALAPGPEGLRQRHVPGRPADKSVFLKKSRTAFVSSSERRAAFSAACASWSSFTAAIHAVSAWRSLSGVRVFLGRVGPLARIGVLARFGPLLESEPLSESEPLLESESLLEDF